MSTLVILGSHRRASDTARLVELLLEDRPHTRLNLLDYTIYPYNYEHCYPTDDNFSQAIELMLSHNQLLFASPVYWYSMSGRMKNFLDRITDMLKIRKEQGRQLRGKQMLVASVSNSEELPPGFMEPFILTAQYLGMRFIGSYFCSSNQLLTPLPGAEAFRRALT